MLMPTKLTPARALLDLLSAGRKGPAPTDVEVDRLISDLFAEITTLDGLHNKGKIITEQRLAEQVFGRRRVFKTHKEAVPHLRYQLRTALEEFSRLVTRARGRNSGTISLAVLLQHKSVFYDYLFDLLEILTPLQHKVRGWEFFSGGKNSSVSSWEVFVLAQGLASQSTWVGAGPWFDHKVAQIASIAVLRQAMELRFERLIAVYPTDRKGKPPKLRHGFHQDFIAGNPQFFNADGFAIKELRHIYDWSSEIVHQAYQPYAWQISMALRRAGDLLRSRSKPSTKSWSIYNSVEIADVSAMQTAYENHFLEVYGHGEWRMDRRTPEAYMPNGQPGIKDNGGDYRPVLNRPSLWRRIKKRVERYIDQGKSG